MKFLTRWLGVEAPGPRVGFRLRREFSFSGSRESAMALVNDAVTLCLGANVEERDDEQGMLSCSFGLIEQRERVHMHVQSLDSGVIIEIEVSFPAGRQAAQQSQALEELRRYFLAHGAKER
ncbi:MAG: hypothetical protein ACYDA1_07710 [Vulcanimicrobiaceae bacterium]